MKKIKLERIMIFLIILFLSKGIMAQEKGIKELDFLIGTWETREDNTESG